MRREELPDPPQRPLAQRLGAILWPSFLLAGAATLAVAVGADPGSIGHLFGLDTEDGPATYSMLFFGLWSVTAASSWITWMLLRSAERLNAEQPDHR